MGVRSGFPPAITPLLASHSVDGTAADVDMNELLTSSLRDHFTGKYGRNHSTAILFNSCLVILSDGVTVIKSGFQQCSAGAWKWLRSDNMWT